MLEVFLSFLGTVITVIVSIATLAYWLGKKFSKIDKELELLNKRIDLTNKRIDLIDKSLRNLSLASTEAHRVIVDFLALKGLIEKNEAEYLSERVRGIFEVFKSGFLSEGAFKLNPLSRKEIEFLKEFLSKNIDEITIEEAERAYEIGRRLFVKDLDERGFLLAMAATYIRGYLVSREVRKRKEAREQRQFT